MWMNEWMSMVHLWNDTDRSKWSSWKETYFSVTLSTSHSTATDLMLNLDLQGDMPLAKHLSYGTDWGDFKGIEMT